MLLGMWPVWQVVSIRSRRLGREILLIDKGKDGLWLFQSAPGG